ncbi:MAG: hypothetical protein Cons2KO_08120 [Congregibacter sp.]
MADVGGGVGPVTRTPPTKQISPGQRRRQRKRQSEQPPEDTDTPQDEDKDKPRKGRFIDERC